MPLATFRNLMSFRIRIFQPIVPAYRVPLFEGVAKRYPGRVEVCAADRMSETDVSCTLKNVKTDYFHKMFRIGPLYWQKGLSLKGLSSRDVVVINGDVRQLSTLWLIIKMRLRGIPYVWWGHHFSATSKMWRARIRLAIMHFLRPSTVLLYTKTGIGWLREMGYKHDNVFATGNTIDTEAVDNARRFWTENKLCKFMADNKITTSDVVLCCSVLREKVHLELLLKALSYNILSSVKAVVIGDGHMKSKWQSLSKDLGVSERVIWVDGTADECKLAPWFMCAKLFVYPGSIGLSILHSFAYGLPVVTHDNIAHQMPEIEVMRNGETGVVFKESDSQDLAAKIRMLLDSGRLSTMGNCARTIIKNSYSMKNMVENFCEAIEHARKTV